MGTTPSNDPLKRLSPYVETVLVLVALAMLQEASRSLHRGHATFAPLLIATCYGTWRGGKGPGLLALGLSGFVGTFFFAEPRLSLSIREYGDIVRLLLATMLGLVIVWFGESLRLEKLRVQAKERELQEANRELGEAKAQLEKLLQRRTDELTEIKRWAAEEG